MSVYRPKYKDPKTGRPRQSTVWWVEFLFAGKRIRESAKTTRKTIASEYERRRKLELERAYAGLPAEDSINRIKTVSDVVAAYVAHYPLNHRAKSVAFVEERMKLVEKHLGSKLLPDLTEDAIRAYIRKRLDEGASGRTVNMELGELSRAIGRKWSFLWPRVRKLEERKDVGQALSPEQEAKILEAAAFSRSPIIATCIRVALLTAMRSGEIASLTWGQVSLIDRLIRVGRAKTSSGTGRTIPMNEDLFLLLKTHADWFLEKFGELRSDYYLFPWGSPSPVDPTRPTTTMKTAWNTIRERAGVRCRVHDLRHTAVTKMGEAGVPESTMLAIVGHMSRAMIERYSHVRLAAKRTAMDSLMTTGKQPVLDGSPKDPPKADESISVQ